jgi:hypothetical protein
MTQDEALKLAEEFGIEDVGNKMYEAWLADPTVTREALVNMFSPKASDKIKAGDSGVRQPLTEAFGVGADKIGALLNPRSQYYWGNMPAKELLKVAMNAGYVKDLPGDASEGDKQQNREDFGKFLNYLAKSSTEFERRNVVRDYDRETAFTKNPSAWAAKMLFTPTVERAKEQALKGQGPSTFGQMDARDLGTLGTDIMANAAFGAGGSLAGQSLAGRGLRSFLQHYGSVAGAGAIGGLGKAAAKDIGTDEGSQWYEYLTEPALGAVTNALGSEIALKLLGNKLSQSTHGIKSMRPLNQKIENALSDTEMKAKDYMDELLKNSNMNIKNGYIRPEDAKRIVQDMRLADEGLGIEPNVPDGETGRFIDELFAINKEGGYSWAQFQDMLDNAIGTARNAAAEGNPYYANKASYLEAIARLFRNGIAEPDKYLPRVHKYLEARGNAANKAQDFLQLEKDAKFLNHLDKEGMSYENVLRDNGYKLSPSTADEGPIIYSDENRLYDYLKLRDLIKMKQKPNPWYGKTSINTKSGLKSQEARDLLDKHQPIKDYFESMPQTKNEAALRAAGAGAYDVIRAGLGDQAIKDRDKEDASPKTVERKFNELLKRKPKTVERVMNWHTDMYEEPSMQLTPEERQLIDQWRVIQMRRNLLGGD